MSTAQSRTPVKVGTEIEKDGTEYEIIEERTVDDPLIRHGFVAVETDSDQWPPRTLKLQWPAAFVDGTLTVE